MSKRLESEKKPKRSAVLKSYLTPEELDQVIEISARTQLSLSEFVRRVCLGRRTSRLPWIFLLSRRT